MRFATKITLLLAVLFAPSALKAQEKHALPLPVVVGDSTTAGQTYTHQDQTDLVDVYHKIFKKAKPRTDTAQRKSGKVRYSGIPAAGYTLQTGFAALLTGNAAFYTSQQQVQNVSVILASVTYSQYKQIILPLLSDIWTKDNKYNIVTDWRYLKYPSLTYGLGGYTSLSDGYYIDFSALRLHQTIYKLIKSDLYLGLGYYLDYFWNIKEVNPPTGKVTDFESYDNDGKTVNKTEVGSGPTLNFLYDKRGNPINPQNGSFVNVIYRPNFTFLGNTSSWQSMVIDLRKYINFPEGSNNVIAFWNYDWLTLSGNPPYLLLPNTGGDPNSNSGRGYIQGRFRGKNMVYLESEYRFAITHNGLFGGVVFANAESFTEQSTNKFATIAPGYGAGIRIKLNKYSKTNLGLDYGFGTGGSGGFFVNLGEVF